MTMSVKTLSLILCLISFVCTSTRHLSPYIPIQQMTVKVSCTNPQVLYKEFGIKLHSSLIKRFTAQNTGKFFSFFLKNNVLQKYSSLVIFVYIELEIFVAFTRFCYNLLRIHLHTEKEKCSRILLRLFCQKKIMPDLALFLLL